MGSSEGGDVFSLELERGGAAIRGAPMKCGNGHQEKEEGEDEGGGANGCSPALAERRRRGDDEARKKIRGVQLAS
ncbi:hypothetical protein HAX54_032046 [Datura stramonium]|uniref:Uncharacterized protein n=1 Tax=Datura stramonium TaxID=4076 RepID=A0ABS8SCC5_DATST|nr:hypothetical protein [Datura stramonium]